MKNRTKTKPTFEGEEGVTPIYDFISLGRLENLIEEELDLFEERTAQSAEIHEKALEYFPQGVGCSWHADSLNMARFPYPLYLKTAKDNKVVDADDNEYIDFNMADTPDIFGHAPDNEVTRGIADHILNNGCNTFYPDANLLEAGRLLKERFGMPYWSFGLSATDANRYCINLARIATGRPKILIFNGGYLGTIEDCSKWRPVPDGPIEWRTIKPLRPGEDPSAVTEVIETNDLEALEEALSNEDIALVLTEPYLTDSGFCFPEEGFHEGLRELCTKYGTYLLIDETHTQTSGPSGCKGLWDLKPDFWVTGKSIAAGISVGVYGFSEELKEHFEAHQEEFFSIIGASGFGTTTTGNPLAVKSLILSLQHNYTDETYGKMFAAADYLVSGLDAVIEKFQVPFRVEKMGARVLISFTPDRCFSFEDAFRSIGKGGYHEFMTLYMTNRGILLLPHVGMLNICPQTTTEDSDVFISLFGEVIQKMLGE